ncbi:MAG: acyl-CoA/acyl-ACP dehydrogenase [Caldilineales bacterium]|nr:acyl-CoA/acyl-ACP dehydrogenase [Caldilineales bacterium]MCW5857468.1 acyl-CoA/acyl-ACP dehydrogenase [Caldilineales bacterium]
MDFSLTAEQQFLRDTTRKFMARECPRDRAHALDAQGAFAAELLARIADLGFCSLNIPEAYGGSGQDLLGAALVVEEIAALSPALAGLFASAAFGGQVLSRLGSPAQQAALLPDIAAGALVMSYAPDAASVTADGHAGAFRLNGRTPPLPYAGRAHALLIHACNSADPDQSHLFLIPTNTPGVRLLPQEMVGSRGSGAASVLFEEAALGSDDLLGGAEQLGRGDAQAAYVTAVMQLAAAAVSLGLAQGAFDYTRAYAAERQQFGQPIGQFPAIRDLLVDLAAGLHACRWLLYHACWLADHDKAFAAEAAIACLQTVALARQAGLQSVHILGGYGYMAEYDAQRYLRDALTPLAGGEASALTRQTIAELIGLAGRP